VQVHQKLALYYQLFGDYDEALAEAERAIEVDPESTGGYLRRAAVRRQLEGETGITEDCDLIASLDLVEPDDILGRANAMREFCNRPDEAMKDYDQAIVLYPDWADTHRYRGWLNASQNHLEEAIDDYNRAIELQPTWHDVIFNRGQTFAALERFEEALADYERVLELGAEGNNGRWALAQAQLRTGRERAALETTALIVDKWPQLADSWARRAQMFFWLGQTQEAVDAVNRGIDLNPQEEFLYVWRAYLSSFLEGSCEAVETDLARQRELAPDAPDTWNNEALVRILGLHHACPERSDPVRAMTLARQAVEYDSRSPAYRETLGISLYRNAQYAEARETLLEAEELYTTEEPRLLFVLAMTEWRLGNKDEALDHHARAVARMIETYPHSTENVLLREEAAVLLGIQG
jgi:tetratricopeptide (TPR) repeat protein